MDSISAAICNSAMPFLYQTKTLSPLSWPAAIAIRRPPLRVAHGRRNFTLSSMHQLSSADSERSSPSRRGDSNEGNSRPLVRAVFTESKYQARRRDDIPWEYLPESRDTSNLQSVEEPDNVDFAYSRSTNPDAEDDDFLAYINDNGEATTLDSEPTKARESTITVSERHAFERIFADIFARSKNREKDGNINATDEEVPATSNAAEEDPKKKLNSIISGALRRNRSSEALRQMKAAVEKYPPALRPAAARALGLDADEVGLTEIEEKTHEPVDPDHVEHLRQPERERVEALMRAAETDFELWEVMEREVFSLVTKMGVDEVQKSPLSKKNSKSKRKQAPESMVTAMPDGVSPLTFYGPLYPSHLLLGLRLLDRSFSQPSALALSILPRIKSLGLVSHILGASTAFYNELLRIYWHRHDDFRGIVDLLEEMEQNGLEFDRETAEVLNEIQRMQTRILKGRKGEALRTVWKLPEFSVQQFGPWRQRVEEAIEEKIRDQPRQLDGGLVRTVAV